MIMTERNIEVGDVVICLAGKGKGRRFIAVDVSGDRVGICDGKTRKTTNLKTKNVKHLKLAAKNVAVGIACDIDGGVPVGNEKVRKLLKDTEALKIKED